jgi:hypothetical protein
MDNTKSSTTGISGGVEQASTHSKVSFSYQIIKSRGIQYLVIISSLSIKNFMYYRSNFTKGYLFNALAV